MLFSEIRYESSRAISEGPVVRETVSSIVDLKVQMFKLQAIAMVLRQESVVNRYLPLFLTESTVQYSVVRVRY